MEKTGQETQEKHVDVGGKKKNSSNPGKIENRHDLIRPKLLSFFLLTIRISDIGKRDGVEMQLAAGTFFVSASRFFYLGR